MFYQPRPGLGQALPAANTRLAQIVQRPSGQERKIDPGRGVRQHLGRPQTGRYTQPAELARGLRCGLCPAQPDQLDRPIASEYHRTAVQTVDDQLAGKVRRQAGQSRVARVAGQANLAFSIHLAGAQPPRFVSQLEGEGAVSSGPCPADPRQRTHRGHGFHVNASTRSRCMAIRTRHSGMPARKGSARRRSSDRAMPSRSCSEDGTAPPASS